MNKKHMWTLIVGVLLFLIYSSYTDECSECRRDCSKLKKMNDLAGYNYCLNEFCNKEPYGVCLKG